MRNNPVDAVAAVFRPSLNTLPNSPLSHITKNWLATKIELYVPIITPIATTSSKPLILGPPISNMANTTRNVVKLVFKDRPRVSIILMFTSLSNA